MSEIERFQPSLMGTREDWADCIPDPEGDYVRFTDHQASLAAVTADRDRMVEALKTAIEEVEFWSGYASDYFKDKHGLAGTLAHLRAALTSTEDRT